MKALNISNLDMWLLTQPAAEPEHFTTMAVRISQFIPVYCVNRFSKDMLYVLKARADGTTFWFPVNRNDFYESLS